jgi:hypothetical protein
MRSEKMQNLQPTDYESAALTVELQALAEMFQFRTGCRGCQIQYGWNQRPRVSNEQPVFP